MDRCRVHLQVQLVHFPQREVKYALKPCKSSEAMQEVAEEKGMVSNYGEEVSENIFEDLVEAAEVTVDLMACAQQDGYLGKLELSCFSAVIVLSVIVCNTPPLFAANHYHRRRRFSGFCRCGCSANGLSHNRFNRCYCATPCICRLEPIAIVPHVVATHACDLIAHTLAFLRQQKKAAGNDETQSGVHGYHSCTTVCSNQRLHSC